MDISGASAGGSAEDPASTDVAQNLVHEATAAEPERRFIDGKWMCEDGVGGFWVYEDEQWKTAEGKGLHEKWEAAGATNGDPYRCVVDGVKMKWNELCQQWLPDVEVDEDFLAGYHANYGIQYDFGESESTSEKSEKKQNEESDQKAKKSKLHNSKEHQGWIELDETKNTSVYVSNLPTTVTEDSFMELMSKCGAIKRDARTNKFKIKLYKCEDGTSKGDGRCCYIKTESVVLALDILDGWNFEGKKIKVEKARFEMKGEYDPAKKKKRLTAAQKKRFLEKQERIFDWTPEKPRNYRPRSDCTIVMKNMFTLQQMMENAALVLDLKEEVRKVSERFGVVKKVVVYDNNPEGVVTVTFENVEHSDTAIRSLNGRIVDGRTISVQLWDGREKFAAAETEEQRAERLKKWHSDITE